MIRLFCFPPADGGAAVFRDWQARLPAAIEVCPVELPRRGGRSLDASSDAFLDLCRELAAELLPRCDRPFSFFGHRIGALVAFELARELRREQKLLPDCLFVAAHRAPRLHNYDYRLEAPLACPIFAFGGIEKQEVPVDQLEPWREETAGEFRLCPLPDQHFFLASAKPYLLGILTHELRVLTASDARFK